MLEKLNDVLFELKLLKGEYYSDRPDLSYYNFEKKYKGLSEAEILDVLKDNFGNALKELSENYPKMFDDYMAKPNERRC